jgi:dipeptidyl aminopeptidase/acylaminoacyl peptidase
VTDVGLYERYRDGIEAAVVGGTVLPCWSPDGKHLAYLDGNAEDRTGWLVELSTGTRTPLSDDVDALRDAVRSATGVTPPGRGLPFDYVVFAGPTTLLTGIGAVQLLWELGTGAVTPIPAESATDTFFGVSESARRTPRPYQRAVATLDPQPATELVTPNGQWLLSTYEGNVMRRDVVDGRRVALTTEGTPEIDYRFDWSDPALAAVGMASAVCNVSPDSQRLAVYRVDNRLVARRPVTHHLQRDDEVVFRHAARAGGAVERYSLHVLDLVSRGLVDIDLGEGDSTYPLPVAWTPDNRQLVVAVFSRDCRTARVLIADAATGSSRELFTETGDTFLRTHQDLYFAKKTGLFLTPDGGTLLWFSERSGYKHLYQYDIDGAFVRPLTAGDFPVDDVLLVTDSHVYLTAHSDPARPYDVHVVRVSLTDGRVERLTEGEGVHRALFAPAGEAFVDTWSTPAQPPRSTVRTADGAHLCDLSTGRLEGLPWTPPQQFTVTAADGATELWGVMFFPADFDQSTTYPLIEYVYGGPQVAAAPHSFGGHFAREAHALAQLGFVTVVLDGRGTPGRSKAFHDVVYKSWSSGIVSDHPVAIEQLRERHSFIRPGGVGVIGDSWGGHSAFRLAAERPDLYAAAICSGPGFDPWSSILYEPYLGLPQDDPAPYEAAACVSDAVRQQAEVLIVTGTADFFSFGDAVKVSEQLIRAGKQHELAILPGQLHSFDSAHDNYVGRKYAAFFARHLQGS